MSDETTMRIDEVTGIRQPGRRAYTKNMTAVSAAMTATTVCAVICALSPV